MKITPYSYERQNTNSSNVRCFGRYQLAAIKRGGVVAMVKSISSNWRAGEALKLTRHLLYAAMDDGLIGRNVAARIELPETRRTPVKILSPGQLEAVVSALPARYRAFVALGAYASLRWSELVAIKRDDLDLEGARCGSTRGWLRSPTHGRGGVRRPSGPTAPSICLRS